MLHTETFTMIMRLMIAGVLSGLVGLEREVKKHPAGFRTHLLVGLGSCLVMLLSFYGFRDIIQSSSNIRFDPSRLPSYVISGIGFLGGGTILVQGATVRGLTTAASIWVVSAIGIVVGAGMYVLAIFTTIVVILSLIFLNKWEQLFIRGTKKASLTIVANTEKPALSKVESELVKKGFLLKQTDVEKKATNRGEVAEYKMILSYSKDEQFIELVDWLTRWNDIEAFSIKN